MVSPPTVSVASCMAFLPASPGPSYIGLQASGGDGCAALPGDRRETEWEMNSPAGAEPAKQLGRRPAVCRQAKLDLHIPDGDATFETEHSIDASHVVAAPLQDLLQLPRLLKRDSGNVAAALVHGRRAIEA